MTKSFLIVSLLGLLWSCDIDLTKEKPLFRLLASEQTGITFNNMLEERYDLNIIVYADFYSGGGVSIGDIDNDGLSDIIFTGNQVPPVLYKNMGHMVFKDITEEANLNNTRWGWFTGTSMVDINNDGNLDIYICRSGLEAPENRANLLYINDGNGLFSERAKEYGIAHQGYGVNASFFDYDKDGDLDIYLVNQGPVKIKRGDAMQLRNEYHEDAGDVLYENIGGKFIDNTKNCGIYGSVIGFAHGVSIGDVNDDGWDDIFVSNDFFEYDYLYINNGDKTFTESIKDATKHISYYSMGNDIADFNNDGLLDIVVLDMVAEGNRRYYANLGGMKENRFNDSVQKGLHYQYMSNVLHLNNGNSTFSDVGTLAGISRTDWSWAPLFADFDNDGFKDLYITNGIRKDIRNIDWGILYNNMTHFSSSDFNFTSSQWDKLLNNMPAEPVTNYVFKNKGDLTFSKVMEEWGTNHDSWSNGVAFGDLDNDGDLDLVVNNIDQTAFVYENQQKTPQFIRFKFSGPQRNTMALGTKVKIYHGNEMQYQQHYLVRGYRSSMEPVMHFGLGKDTLINKVEVTWPDGNESFLYGISSNQEILLDYRNAPNSQSHESEKNDTSFEDITRQVISNVRHSENEMNDYDLQPHLPYKISTMGPALAIADVNNDGLDDFFIGGSYRLPPQLLIQQDGPIFVHCQQEFWMDERMYEDVGATFMDTDNDGDMDLYVVSGGIESTLENEGLRDRLYINDGNGIFTKSGMLLPNISGSVAVPFDFDDDGDTDVFVGGRVSPGRYPLPVDSYLLENNHGELKDATDELAPELRNFGMVTDAIWSDYDQDGDHDLIIVGEWMPISILRNESGTFRKVNNRDNGLENSSGWWWTIESDDIDNDGDPDYIAGNMGFNCKFRVEGEGPLEIFAGDFDQNKSLDIAMGYHQDGRLFPVADRSKAILQTPDLEEIIPTSNEYAASTLFNIYGKEKLDKAAAHYSIHTIASSYLENRGNGKFVITPLPNRAQISNVNAVAIEDIDFDGNKDLIVGGNLYFMERETIRNDGGIGLWLKGDGQGNFTPITLMQGGIFLPGDVRHLGKARTRNGNILICAKNSDDVQCIKMLE